MIIRPITHQKSWVGTLAATIFVHPYLECWAAYRPFIKHDISNYVDEIDATDRQKDRFSKEVRRTINPDAGVA
jgi:hypothetical protein